MFGSRSVEPLLKWTGGKRWLRPWIFKLAPTSYRRYFEPFLGGGAIFFGLRPQQAILSDNNEELINCYIAVRDDPESVVDRLKKFRNTEAQYYRVRESRPRSKAARAARLIYLTNLSFNGIYRTNQKGEFNVPYGRRTHLPCYDRTKIYQASEILRRSSLLHADFEKATKNATAGDLVYLDPPYTVAHGNNGFLRYNQRILRWEDQERLANLARTLANRGCHVIVSNADHPSVLALYKGFELLRVPRPSCMAASLDARKTITECVFYS